VARKDETRRFCKIVIGGDFCELRSATKVFGLRGRYLDALC